MDLKPYLEDLQRRIDPAQEERLMADWVSFAQLEWKEEYFAPARAPAPPLIQWKPILINDALESDELMLYQQLYLISEMLRTGSGEVLCLRSNFGTGIIPGMYGAEVFIMPRDTDTLPGTRPLPGGKEDILAILAAGKTDFTRGFAGRVFTVAERYLEEMTSFPGLAPFLHYYNPDLQGPLSLCEAMWGSELYYEFYDEPETVEQALDFFAEVYLEFTRRWHALMPPVSADHSVEWGCLHRGHTIIRNDTAMNVSGDIYEEFVMPRDQRIIDAFGGGVHFCGRGDHYVEHLSAIRGLSCINLSQPECNNMETIYQNTVDKDIVIFGLRSDEVERAVGAGRALGGRVQRGASAAAWLDHKDR